MRNVFSHFLFLLLCCLVTVYVVRYVSNKCHCFCALDLDYTYYMRCINKKTCSKLDSSPRSHASYSTSKSSSARDILTTTDTVLLYIWNDVPVLCSVYGTCMIVFFAACSCDIWRWKERDKIISKNAKQRKNTTLTVASLVMHIVTRLPLSWVSACRRCV